MTEPIRVLHFQGRMGKGGAETFMMNTYRNIDRAKIQFDFLIYEDFQDVKNYHDEIFKLGGRIYIVPNPKKNIIGYIVAVKKLLREKKFEIVHNEVFFGGGLNLWLAHQANISKRIAHSHATTDGKTNNIINKLTRKFLDKLMFRYGTDFLACSYDAGRGLFGENHNFIFVPNGIDISKYRNVLEDKEVLKKQLNLESDTFVIGNIGRLENQKNHEFLLDIFNEVYKKNSNSHLLLIGEGSLKESLLEKVNQLQLSNKVTFLGVRNDIPQLLKVMDVFVMPSLYEGLPISAIEAQASNNKLVLSTEVSKETQISENVHFVSLNNSAEEWATIIMSEPLDNKPTDKMKIYRMKHTAEIMTDIYLNN